MPPKTQRERDADKRKEKLDLINQQVESGSLVIRKMTEKERKKYAPSKSEAELKAARADHAERVAQKERAEAELHESRARLHEKGLADDELDRDVPVEDETTGERRFARGDTVRDDAVRDDTVRDERRV